MPSVDVENQVEEVTRTLGFWTASRMHVRLCLPPGEAWERVRSLFAAVLELDEGRRLIRGRVLGLRRPMMKLAQQVEAAFEERAPGYPMVVFSISIRFIGRAMDRRVFDDIVARLKDPSAPTIDSDWFTRQLAGGRSGTEVLAFPVAAFTLVSQLVVPLLVGMGLGAQRSGSYGLFGIINGLVLSDLFLIGPLAVLSTLGLSISILRRRVVRGAATLALGLAAAFLWWSHVTAVMKPS